MMGFTGFACCLRAAFAAIALMVPAMSAAQETVSLTVEGISTVSSEDNPGIVYILPWQPPTLPRRDREGLATNAAELLEPVDPLVFERHQNFQQSLNPDLDSSNTLR
ncbi:hypothetical protein [Marinobacter confluentis]|uniref:TonB-dependent receptor n=1 Tax=Marinobacter confluentis TaxID=1697557 RepID=A0A4Z1CJB1_9GAMM|nr:hypothetical protein [Marinobacter confluentis]TGN41552.1 hypothetical protein E5Q11_03190 [Marinobacter confluentis]